MKIQHPVSDEFLKHIGDVTVSFSLLERTMQTVVAELLACDQRIGLAVSAELSFKVLRSLISSLSRECLGEGPISEKACLLVKRAAAIEDRRNQITHSLWAVGDTTNSITRIKATAKNEKGLKFQFEQVTTEHLAGLADDIKTLTFDFQRLVFEVVPIKAAQTKAP